LQYPILITVYGIRLSFLVSDFLFDDLALISLIIVFHQEAIASFFQVIAGFLPHFA
jgi:hypothetical protein